LVRISKTTKYFFVFSINIDRKEKIQNRKKNIDLEFDKQTEHTQVLKIRGAVGGIV